jgi:hypothetical protein
MRGNPSPDQSPGQAVNNPNYFICLANPLASIFFNKL